MENTNNNVNPNNNSDEVWEEVGFFGAGKIYASGDRRKLVTDGHETFFFSANESRESLKSKQKAVTPKGDIKLDA